jgi:hypothetical protein
LRRARLCATYTALSEVAPEVETRRGADYAMISTMSGW